MFRVKQTESCHFLLHSSGLNPEKQEQADRQPVTLAGFNRPRLVLSALTQSQFK